jgi:hypothetical protein
VKCSVDECDGEASVRGWCDKHYRRWLRNGDPLVLVQQYAQQGDIPSEEWRSIPSHPDYEASSRGRIRRKTKGYRRPAGWILRQHRHPRGYLTVGLYRGKRFSVHVLVCESFHGTKPLNREVNHRDSNKMNNAPTNLEWLTRRENIHHAIAAGTHPGRVVRSV